MHSVQRSEPEDSDPKSGIDSRDFVRLLSQHFGDGLVYLADDADRLLLKNAIDYGLISPDGRVTAAGYRLWRNATGD
jgi:hypothetical protein